MTTENKNPEVEEVEEVTEEIETTEKLESGTDAQSNQSQATQVKIDKKVILKSAIQNLNKIKKEMKDMFLEREEVIDSSILALATSSHVLLYGPPGTGKSLITREIAKRIDNSNYFEWLLTKGSDISELFGGLSIKGIEQDKYIRNYAGKLPEAEIAFLDEIYKSNSPTLNSLLTAINERVFHNDGKPVKIPLISLFAASNEIPEEDEGLAALHDRFLTRLYVEDINDPSNMIELYNRSLNGTFTNNGVFTSVTLEELKVLNSYVGKVRVPDIILNELASLMFRLGKAGIKISARRQVAILKLLQGNALLNGRTMVDFKDFKCLKPVLWHKVKEIEFIEDELSKIKDPWTSKLDTIVEAYYTEKSTIEAQNSSSSPDFNVILSAKGEIETLIKRLQKLVKDVVKQGQSDKKFTEKVNEMRDFVDTTMNKALNNNTTDQATDFPDIDF